MWYAPRLKKGGIVQGMMRAIRSGHWPSLVAAWLHFGVSFMVWLLVGALGIMIAEDFSLTATQKGLLVTVPLLSGALLRIPVGIGSDRFGPKPVGLVLLVVELVAVCWGWLGATSYLHMLGVGFCLGAAGASFAVAMPLASRAYPPAHRGLAMGVAASANGGVVLVAFFAPRLVETVGWHGVFGLMAVPILLTLPLFALLVRRDIGWSAGEGSPRWKDEMAWLLKNPLTYWLCAAYAATFGGFEGLSSFLPIFFHDQYGLDAVTAGTLTAACGLAGSAIRPFGGHAADRRGGFAVLAVVLPVIVVLMVAVGFLPALHWVAPLAVAAALVMGFGNGAIFQVVSDRYPKGVGTVSGLVGAAGALGGFVLPMGLGVLKDSTGTYQSGFLLFASLVGAAWIGTLFFVRRRNRVS
jgi:MFS transporter, NNP family, nitrate/nitrite transporter